jgi:hypothetical protein
MQTAENVLSRCGVEVFGLFVQLVRQVWFRRNKWVYEGVWSNPIVIIRNTEELAENFTKKKKKSRQFCNLNKLPNTRRSCPFLSSLARTGPQFIYMIEDVRHFLTKRYTSTLLILIFGSIKGTEHVDLTSMSSLSLLSQTTFDSSRYGTERLNNLCKKIVIFTYHGKL